MRLQSFEHDGRTGWGIVEDDGIRDMTEALPGIGSIKALLEADALETARAAALSAPLIAADAVRPLPVIPDPAKILCCGLNYHEHRIETDNPERAHPTLFVRFADAQIGHGVAIEHPAETTMLDYEAELAVVIGKRAHHVPRAAAMEHVAGYACYNDVSVRDWQRHTTQMTPGKNFPTTGPFGPWLVTRDEIDDLAPLRIQCRLNGTVMQDARLGDMIFDIPALIEYITTFTALSPGDVILTGTPGGVGVRRDPQVFLKPGDRVEVEIEKIGLLSNPVV